MNDTEPTLWQVNIGFGNGLFPSSNKPLPEPMLIQIYNAIWHHKSTMSWIDICSIWIACPNRTHFSNWLDPWKIWNLAETYLYMPVNRHKNSHIHISRPRHCLQKCNRICPFLFCTFSPFFSFFFTAYIQGVGRAGEPAVATLYYNSTDIAPSLEHLQRQMKDYCKLHSCRRKHFGLLQTHWIRSKWPSYLWWKLGLWTL